MLVGALASAVGERVPDGDRVADHPDRLEGEVAPQLLADEHPRVLDRDPLPGDLRQDPVPAPEIRGADPDLGRRSPPAAAASLQNRLVELVQLGYLPIAARVEPVAL